MIAINLFHVLVVFPVLLILASFIKERKLIPINTLYLMGAVAVAGLLYHASKVVQFVQEKGTTQLVANKAVNLFHMMVVFPALLWLVYSLINHQPISENVAHILMAVSVVGILYHGSKVLEFVQLNGVGALMDKNKLM